MLLQVCVCRQGVVSWEGGPPLQGDLPPRRPPSRRHPPEGGTHLQGDPPEGGTPCKGDPQKEAPPTTETPLQAHTQGGN